MTHPSDEEPKTSASSPPKPNLMTMPTEILLEIIGATEHGSLLAFARCTKRLNLLITPYIYQSVCYVYTQHTTYQSARYPDWASTHPKNCHSFGHRADTRIYDVAKLRRTISWSLKLRSAIGAASFVWRDNEDTDCYVNVSDIIRIMALLDGENFQLHMAPPDHHRSWSRYNWPKSLRSLEPSVQRYSPAWEVTGRDLYKIFCQRNLQQITLKDIWVWEMLNVPVNKYPSRISGVKCMQIIGGCPLIGGVSPIFNWPSALHSFRHFVGYKDSGPPVIPSLWVKFLYSHQKSLKELLISIVEWHRSALECNGLSMGSGLRAFENIKLLDVPWVFLIKKEHGSSFTNLDTHQILPPMLEVLQVELPRDYEWNPFLGSKDLKPKHKTVGLAPLELRNWLTQIAHYKSSYYPLLKELTIWQQFKYPFTKPWETVWTHNLEGVEGFAEPKSVCLLADIDLSWITCNLPPHFCVSSPWQR